MFASFGFFFQKLFLERGLHISMPGRFIFSWWFISRWRGHPIGVASALIGVGAKKFIEREAPQSCLFPLGQTLVYVIKGLKRSMNYNIENLQKKDLNFTRRCTSSQKIFKTFTRSVQHVYLMVDFKPSRDLSRH